jgi:ubiquitin-protein ligase
MMAWPSVWKERVDWEIDALRRAGVLNTVEQNAKTCECVLSLSYPWNGEKLDLTVSFPPYYPIVRFEVQATRVDLPHHQGPQGGNLCLLNWSKWRSDDTVLSLLESQLTKVMVAGNTEDREEARALEELQAEPNSHYIQYLAQSVGLIEDQLIPQNLADRGFFSAKVGLRKLGDLRQFCIGVTGVDDTGIATISFEHLSEVPTSRCRWFRFPAKLSSLDARGCFEALSGLYPELKTPQWTIRQPNASLELIGVAFKEETSWRDEGWSFGFLLREAVTLPGFRKGKVLSRDSYIRPNRVGRDTMFMRAPELKSLEGKNVALAGVGCIGAPVAISLSQAGLGSLRMMDDDVLEAATAVRWPLGVAYAGTTKVAALGSFIKQNYPYTDISLFTNRIGGIPTAGGTSLAMMEKFLNGADVIVDATGDQHASRILSREAKLRSIPHIILASTPGGWGGTIGIFSPTVGGCFECFLHSMRADCPPEYRIPVAPSDPNVASDTVQAPGCAAPTFTASGFDVAQVSMSATRAIVSLLCEGDVKGYPSLEYGIMILELRDADGKAILPRWSRYQLHRHPQCENHPSSSGYPANT